MLIVGLLVQFWSTPKEGLSENDKALARIARMEASVAGHSTKAHKKETDTSKFVENIKNAQEKQIQYFTILSILFGIGFLGYSFISQNHENEDSTL